MVMLKTDNLIHKKSSGSYVVLFNLSLKNYPKQTVMIVQSLVNKKHLPGVYLTINKPYNTLINTLNNNKIHAEMIIFIDAISNLNSSKKHNDHSHVTFLENPQDLSDMGIAVAEALESIHNKKKFLIVDAMSTLLLYNDEDLVAKFFHFLISKIRDMEVITIILNIKTKKDRNLVNEVGQFCDTVLGV